MSDESFSKLEVDEPAEFQRDTEGSQGDRLPKERVERKSNPWLIPLLLGTGLGVAIAFGGMHILSNRPPTQQTYSANKPAQNVAPSMTVTVARVETTRVARNISTTNGTVAARELTPVLPQTNGLQIKQVLVNEGDNVKKGQVLAILDDSIVQDQVRQARADVESKEADVASKQADLQSKQAAITSSIATVASSQAAVAATIAVVQQRQADLAQAKARLEDAQRTLRRNQELLASGAISRQVLDTSATSVATATEAVNLAAANIRSAQENVKSAQANVSSAQAGVKNAEANVSIARANINSAQAAVRSNNAKVQQFKTQQRQTVVTAPVSGIIAEKLARVGDVTGVPPQSQFGTVIGGSQKLFSIIQNGSLELQIPVPEALLAQIKVGSRAEISFRKGTQNVRLQGRVRDIEAVINQQRREAVVKIDLPATDLLKPGMSANAEINTTTTIGMALTQKAVQPQPDGSAIVFMLLGEDTVRATKVELGEPLNKSMVEIKSGLKAGDKVVVDGAGYVKDGDKVRVAVGG